MRTMKKLFNPKRKHVSRRVPHAVQAALLLASLAPQAHAGTGGGGGSGLPWETVLQRIVDSFTGPVVQGVLVLAIVALGFAVMWSEGPVIRRAFGLLLGGAIAAAAVSIALTLFGVSGATF